MSKLPAAILFDADGTLYDSSPLHFEAYKIVSRKLYDFEFTWELFRSEIMHGNKKAPEVLQAHGIDVTVDEFYHHKQAAYEQQLAKRLKPMSGLKDFLEWCHGNHIRCFVVSASTRASVEASLCALGLRSYFEEVISHEDIGDKRKPDPYPYLRGLEAARLTKKDVVAIEDAASGVTSAQAAGITCIGILNQTNDREHLVEADHIIVDYIECKQYLLSG